MIGVGSIGLIPARVRTSKAHALARIDPNQLDLAIPTGRHPLSKPGHQIVINTSACLNSDGEIPLRQARPQGLEAIARHVKLAPLPDPFPSRVDKRSREKRLARVNPQYQTRIHGSPPWVIPQPGLSALQRSAFVKRGPVRDELGQWAEERPLERALSSRRERFLPPIFVCGTSRRNCRLTAIFHISTAIHNEKEAKRKLLLLLIFTTYWVPQGSYKARPWSAVTCYRLRPRATTDCTLRKQRSDCRGEPCPRHISIPVHFSPASRTAFPRLSRRRTGKQFTSPARPPGMPKNESSGDGI